MALSEIEPSSLMLSKANQLLVGWSIIASSIPSCFPIAGLPGVMTALTVVSNCHSPLGKSAGEFCPYELIISREPLSS